MAYRYMTYAVVRYNAYTPRQRDAVVINLNVKLLGARFIYHVGRSAAIERDFRYARVGDHETLSTLFRRGRFVAKIYEKPDLLTDLRQL